MYGKKGSGAGQFGGNKIGPFGVAVYESASQLFFADPYLSRVSRWSLSGTTATFLSHIGAAGRSAGNLFYPFGVSVHQATGNLYVLNTNNHRVEVSSA